MLALGSREWENLPHLSLVAKLGRAGYVPSLCNRVELARWHRSRRARLVSLLLQHFGAWHCTTTGKHSKADLDGVGKDTQAQWP